MKDVILYGAGSDLWKIIPMLKDIGYDPLCIADGNEKKVGGNYQGIPIVSPERIIDYNSRIIIISASFFDSIYERISDVLGDKLD